MTGSQVPPLGAGGGQRLPGGTCLLLCFLGWVQCQTEATFPREVFGFGFGFREHLRSFFLSEAALPQ